MAGSRWPRGCGDAGSGGSDSTAADHAALVEALLFAIATARAALQAGRECEAGHPLVLARLRALGREYGHVGSGGSDSTGVHSPCHACGGAFVRHRECACRVAGGARVRRLCGPGSAREATATLARWKFCAITACPELFRDVRMG